jgi:hypothetical protein
MVSNALSWCPGDANAGASLSCRRIDLPEGTGSRFGSIYDKSTQLVCCDRDHYVCSTSTREILGLGSGDARRQAAKIECEMDRGV